MEGVADPGTSFSIRQNIGGVPCLFSIAFCIFLACLPLFFIYFMLIAGSSCFMRLYAVYFYFLLYIYGSYYLYQYHYHYRLPVLLPIYIPGSCYWSAGWSVDRSQYIYISLSCNYCYILIPLLLLFSIAISVRGCFAPQY